MNKKDFYYAVCMVAQRQGITRYRLAMNCGKPVKSFSAAIQGDVRLSTLFTVAEGLGVPPRELFEEVVAQRELSLEVNSEKV